MMRSVPFVRVLICTMSLALLPIHAAAETKTEYANRFVMVLDWVKKTSNFMRDHINDKGLARHLQDLAARQVDLSSVLTPPEEWKPIHPHFLLVLENTERAFYFAARGELASYRRHSHIMREELRMVETLIARNRIQLPDPPM